MTDAELIKEVAEKAMGWEYIVGSIPITFRDKNDDLYTIELTSYKQFNPLTNANHRDMVVERMRDTGHEIIITTPVGSKYLWEVSIDSKIERHESLGHAVCLAVKAIGENIA